MQIDRARFLVLTMAISAGGCAPPEPPTTAAADGRPTLPPVVDVAPPDDRPALLVAEPSPEQAAPVSSEPLVAAGEGAHEPGNGELAAPEFADGYATAGGSAGGRVGPFAARGRSASKLGEQCRALRPPPGPQCESFDTTVPECEAYERALVPEAAERAVRCLSKKSGSAAICKFGVTAECFLQGTRGTKTAADAERRCGPAVGACAGQRWREPDLNKPNCLAAVSATAPAWRGALISCIAESCGIANCYYAIESS